MIGCRVSIIMPAFNESAAIRLTIGEILNAFPEAEVMVVDDGSIDGTADIAAQMGARVLLHERNLGYGAALRTGILAAKRDYVLFCDADGQHTSENVQAVLDQCDESVAMVVGARNHLSNSPLLRRPGKWILRKWANFLAGQRIPDLNSGLRIIKKEVILQYLHLMPRGFSFSTTSTFALLYGQHPIRWVPVTISPRVGVSSVHQLHDGFRALLLMLRLTVLFSPLRIFLTVAGALFLLSFGSLSLDLILNPVNGIGDTTALLWVSSLLVFMSGLLCDQVSALRRELHER